jgi:hypothetical protein
MSAAAGSALVGQEESDKSLHLKIATIGAKLRIEFHARAYP